MGWMETIGDTKKVDWETFASGNYAIVSAPLTSGGDDSEYAYYQVGEKIAVTLPDGSSRDYEILGIGDVSYAMGPQHSHGMDINITISGSEYKKAFPDTKGAHNYFVNYQLEDAKFRQEEYVTVFQQYCAELLLEDATIAQYDPEMLARENLTEKNDHPYLSL